MTEDVVLAASTKSVNDVQQETWYGWESKPEIVVIRRTVAATETVILNDNARTGSCAMQGPPSARRSSRRWWKPFAVWSVLGIRLLGSCRRVWGHIWRYRIFSDDADFLQKGFLVVFACGGLGSLRVAAPWQLKGYLGWPSHNPHFLRRCFQYNLDMPDPYQHKWYKPCNPKPSA